MRAPCLQFSVVAFLADVGVIYAADQADFACDDDRPAGTCRATAAEEGRVRREGLLMAGCR